MKTVIDGRTYTIEFGYGSRFTTGVSSEWTACLIRDATNWEQPVAAMPPVVASGEVTRYYRDTPNREVARKKAMAIAVGKLFPADDGRSEDVLRKRQALWWCYFNRKSSKTVRGEILEALPARVPSGPVARSYRG